MAVDGGFRRRLEFDQINAPVNVSEQAISEFLIAPILQEMWRAYSDALMIWSHVQFGHTPPLKGFPDYFFTKRSPSVGFWINRMCCLLKPRSISMPPGHNAWQQCWRRNR